MCSEICERKTRFFGVQVLRLPPVVDDSKNTDKRRYPNEKGFLLDFRKPLLPNALIWLRGSDLN
jgi:hypothetical protein